MAYKTLLTKNYMPTRPKKYNNQDKFDLHDRLNQIKFDEIIQNSDSYFENAKITNFDLIHNECRGSELLFTREHYQTLYNKKLNSEILDPKQKSSFISSAIRCHRDDVIVEKKIIDEHFLKNLEKKIIFLSNMRRMKFKKTDDCENLLY